jgi:hypothetical protein
MGDKPEMGNFSNNAKKWLKKLQVDQTVQHLASAKRNKLV